LQDDANDWAEAATTMASIYENSIITIAATWSSDSNGGCFSTMRELYQAHTLKDMGLYVRIPMPNFPVDDLDYIIDDWPLLQRGWVFQERKLAARVVHYAKDQLFWECKSSFLSQDGTHRWQVSDPFLDLKLRRFSWTPLKMEHVHPVASWRKIVCTYTGLQLTRSSDLLPALAGIVERETSRRNDDVYVAGMWKKTLLDDLAFYTKDGPHTDSNAPIWSWMSGKGQVYFTPLRKPASLKLLDLTFTRIGPPNLGNVTDASILIRGPVLWASTKSLSPLELHPITAFGARVRETISIELSASPTFRAASLVPGRALKIVILSEFSEHPETVGMGLQEASKDKYERLGLVYVRYLEDGQWPHPVNPPSDKLRRSLNGYVANLPVQEFRIV
jgi:hypothetical protein